eukprot:CAMPEP_0205923680 /NCGR_PEP_ID=MMETSP1325-20131115/16544_1 /ASSEMBLY_ACC=CAM_ASM_000708 /TAXON_ID=236786 /ORGANISM="Florenciella sp., Strain RCC1007" /LENGTH=44 /DNA_ID= /DNA_START= /DNA_END= /DNA_ORIENTATION=
MNAGHHYTTWSYSFTLSVQPLFKLGWLYYGPITDFGWTYNMNLA